MDVKRWCGGWNSGVGDEIVGWGDGDEKMMLEMKYRSGEMVMKKWCQLDG